MSIGKVKNLNEKELAAYSKFHKGGPINLDAVLNHPDSLILFQTYHSSANPELVAKKLAALGGDTSICDLPQVKLLRNAVQKATSEHWGALTLYAMYKFFTSCVLLPFTLIWRTMDCTNVVLRLVSAVYANALLAFLIITYAFTIFHMRHHIGRTFNNPILNAVCSMWFEVVEYVFLMPPPTWVANHNYSHHVYTNLLSDYDVSTPYPALRVSPAQEWKWFHRFQSVYALPLLGFNSLLFPMHNLNMGTPLCLFSFAVYYVVLLVVPVMVFGATWTNSIISYFAVMYAIGLPTALLFQVSHNHPSNHTNHNRKPTSFNEWLALQYAESASWGGLFSCVCFGGINYQTEHHLWPAVHPILLHFMLEDSRELAKLVKAKYIFEKSFFSAMVEYVIHLHRMGDSNVRASSYIEQQ